MGMARVKKTASGRRLTLGGGGPARRKLRGESLMRRWTEKREREKEAEREKD
jgi:hypothetical protein